MLPWSNFFSLQPVITLNVVDISKTILPLSLSCLILPLFHHPFYPPFPCYLLILPLHWSILFSSPSSPYHLLISSLSPLLQPGWPPFQSSPVFSILIMGWPERRASILSNCLTKPRAQLQFCCSFASFCCCFLLGQLIIASKCYIIVLFGTMNEKTKLPIHP